MGETGTRGSGPVAVVECATCGAVTTRPVPPGWVAAGDTPGQPPYRYGACPRCVEARYTYPARGGAVRPARVAATSVHSQ